MTTVSPHHALSHPNYPNSWGFQIGTTLETFRLYNTVVIVLGCIVVLVFKYGHVSWQHYDSESLDLGELRRTNVVCVRHTYVVHWCGIWRYLAQSDKGSRKIRTGTTKCKASVFMPYGHPGSPRKDASVTPPRAPPSVSAFLSLDRRLHSAESVRG